MSSSIGRDLAQDLHVWLMNEMQYDASGEEGYKIMPSPENLSELLVGQLPDVWKFLLENVYGPHTIHVIKGNLQLCKGHGGKKLMSSPMEKSLQSRREALVKSLRHVNSGIQHLETEIAKLEEEIIRKRHSVVESREGVRREQRLAACVRLHSARVWAETSRASELAGHLGRLAASDPQVPSTSAAAAGRDTAEMDCMRQISTAAELLGAHVSRSLDRLPADDSLARAEQMIAAAVRRYSPEDVIRALSGLQQRAAIELARWLEQEQEQEQPQQSHQQQQQQLSAVKRSPADCVTRKIQQSVDELHALHVTWRLAENAALEEAKRLRAEVHQLSSLLADSGEQHEEVDWGGHFESAASRGRAVAMETAVQQLNAETAKLAETRTALEQRYAAIVKNQEVIEQNKSQVQLVVALGRDSLALTGAAQRRSLAAAQMLLAPPLADLLAAHARLAEDVTAEADAVARLVLADARWVAVDGWSVPSCRLAVCRPPPSDPALLRSRRLRSAEADLLARLAAEWRRQRAAAEQQRELALREALTDSAGRAELLEECRRRVEAQMEQERVTLMPQLEKMFVNMSQIGAALKQARLALQNWTEQPGRTACQGVQHAGLSLKQWEQRYMAAAAESRRHRLPQQQPQE